VCPAWGKVSPTRGWDAYVEDARSGSFEPRPFEAKEFDSRAGEGLFEYLP